MTFPRARWARSTLVGGVATALATLTLVAPAHAAIIGTTNDLKRMPSTATAAPPYSAVVEIDLGPGTTLDGKALGRCTGWLYASNMVATAGHCIYDQTSVSGGWFNISQMTVTPGINGTYKPFQTCGVVNAYVPPEWTMGQSRTQEGNPSFDYGALKLNCTVGDQTKLLKYGAAPIVGYPTRVVGYPHRETAPTMYPDHSQWYSDDQVRSFNGYQVFYANDTEKRMSGAPVMQWDGYEYNVVAIHHGDYNTSYNVGTRVSDIVVSDLQYWQYYG